MNRLASGPLSLTMGAMELPEGIIRVRSEKQAMDWSLVLASQGIENTIDYVEESAAWGLLVGSRALHS